MVSGQTVEAAKSICLVDGAVKMMTITPDVVTIRRVDGDSLRFGAYDANGKVLDWCHWQREEGEEETPMVATCPLSLAYRLASEYPDRPVAVFINPAPDNEPVEGIVVPSVPASIVLPGDWIAYLFVQGAWEEWKKRVRYADDDIRTRQHAKKKMLKLLCDCGVPVKESEVLYDGNSGRYSVTVSGLVFSKLATSSDSYVSVQPENDSSERQRPFDDRKGLACIIHTLVSAGMLVGSAK